LVYRRSEMLVIRASQLIDGNGGAPLRGMAVVVEGERIIAVEPAEAMEIPPDAEVIDASDQTLMPGMIDAHVHIELPGGPAGTYAAEQASHVPGYLALKAHHHAMLALRAGFTALRSLHSPGYEDVALRDGINAGLVQGPRIRAAGRGLTVTDGHMDKAVFSPEAGPFGPTNVCDGPDDFRRGARAQLKRGVDLIKINAASYNLGEEDSFQEMTYEEMAAACQVAHWAGKKVAAHAHGGPGITDAIRAGLDSVEHGVWLSDEQADLMAEQGVFYVPTLRAHTSGMELGREGIGYSDLVWEWLLRVCDARWPSLERARRAGVKIVCGTDAGFWSYHGQSGAELEELVRGGLTPMEAIVAATRTAAECLDLDRDTGTVAHGKYADLVIVDGDPLADIRILQDPARIAQVFIGGEKVA
jgi:imidazolonepropionase-like amidohydrolase